MKRALAVRRAALRAGPPRPDAGPARKRSVRPAAAAFAFGLGAVVAAAGVLHQVAPASVPASRSTAVTGVAASIPAPVAEPAASVPVPVLALADLPAGYSLVSQSPATLKDLGPVRASSDVLFQHGRRGAADFTLLEGIVVRYGSDGQAATAARSQGAEEAAGGAERRDISDVLPGGTLWIQRLADGGFLARVIMRIGTTVGVVGAAGGGSPQQVDTVVAAAHSLSDRLAAGG